MTKQSKTIRELRNRLAVMKSNLSALSENQALNYLDGKDLIEANHVFFERFGKNIPEQYTH